MLELQSVQSGYGSVQVLYDVSLKVGQGEVVTLLGRNGMGKTTTVSTIMGILPATAGTISFDGGSIARKPPFRIARIGIALVPEGRQVFPNLTVHENLHVAGRKAKASLSHWDLGKVLDLLPALQPKLPVMGRLLSGGEQQMLAIGRALMTNPRLLILDEATEGLAPMIRGEIWRCITKIKSTGQSILVIDKNVKALMAIADRHYFIEKGRIVHTCSSDTLRQDRSLQHRYLGV